MNEGDRRYGEVRRELERRGYLDGRVERFLLRDARAGLPRLARSAVRAALVGALPLGGLLAAAAALANRPWLGMSDTLLLWAYFSLLAAAALFLADLAAGGLSAAIAARRGVHGSDAQRAALLVGLPTLAYLLLLRFARRTPAPLLEDGLFLLFAVLVALMVARLAGIVSVGAMVGRTGRAPDRPARPLAWLAWVIVPAAALLVAVVLLAAPAAGPSAPPPFEPDPAAPGIWVVGVDGLDVALFDTLLEAGELPALASLASPRLALRSLGAGVEPPEVWTTLMTGQPVERHGLRHPGGRLLPGMRSPLQEGTGPLPLDAALRFLLPAREVPTSGLYRQVPSLWEITGTRARTLAVGWWATWPAAPTDGYTVTDRVLPKLLAGLDADRDTAPDSLFTRLTASFEERRQRLRSEFEATFPAAGDAQLRRWLWDSWLIDGWSWETAGELGLDPEVRFAFVYLPGLDILRQRIAALGPDGDASALAAQRAIAAYLAWLDRRVASLPSGREALLVADPGRRRDGDSRGFVAGPLLAARGCAGVDIGPLDVAPLLLALSGFPQSEELAGELPRGCETWDPRPDRVPGYGRRERPAGPPTSPDDPELLERLRSLGYVQ